MSVVTPQKMLKGIINLLFVLGIYPCAKGHVYKNNRTTNAIERRVTTYLRHNISVLFVDAVLFSTDIQGTNTKTFNPQKMLETLRDNPALIEELFSRLCDQFRTWAENALSVFKFPVCAIAGKCVERYAYEAWKSTMYKLIEEKERIYRDDGFGFTVVLCWIQQSALGKEEVLFILGGDHPSAHLRGNPEQVERFDRLSLLEAVAMELSMEVARREMTTEDFDSRKDYSLKGMFSTCLEKRDKEYEETRKARLTGLKTTLGSAGILKDVAANYDSLVEGNNDVYLKDTHKCLRHAQFEDAEVCKNVETFVNTFGKEVAVRCFKSGTFVCGLCQKETSEAFLERFRGVLAVFKGDKDLLAKACCDSLFAALADADDGDETLFKKFLGRFIRVLDEVFKDEEDLLAQACCSSLFAALADEDDSDDTFNAFLRRVIEVLRVVFEGKKKSFARACCDSLFAALADADDGDDFIVRIIDFIKDYHNGDCDLFATRCCVGLFAAINSEAKTVELRKRIDLLIVYDGDGDKNLYGVNNTFLAVASGGSFYAGLSGVEGDKYAEYLLEIRSTFYETNPHGFAFACSRNYMCALLSYKKDGKLTGELISNLEEIQKELFAGSDLGMTQDLWKKFSKEKREEKAWKKLTGAEKEKFSDAEKDKRLKGAVHAFIQHIQQERLRLEERRRIQQERLEEQRRIQQERLEERRRRIQHIQQLKEQRRIQRIEEQRLEKERKIQHIQQLKEQRRIQRIQEQLEEERRIQQDRLEEQRRIQCIQERLEEQQRSQRIQQEILEWTPEEEWALKLAFKKWGQQWTKIAEYFKYKTAEDCENKYHELLKEGKMEMEEEKENEDGDDDEDKRQGGGEARVPFQPVNK